MSFANDFLTPRPADNWENRRRQDMRIKNVRYGFFHINREIEQHECSICKKEVSDSPSTVVINGEWMHKDCWLESR